MTDGLYGQFCLNSDEALQQRHLLYLRPDGNDDNVCKTIERRGWIVDRARHLEEALHCMEARPYSVGLVHWDGLPQDTHQVESLAEELACAGSRINLVALLSNVANITGPLAPIIYRYFYDYHTLPIDTNRLLVTLGHAHGMAQLSEKMRSQEVSSIHGMIGQSPQMQALLRDITRVAATDFNVLVRGESGTGKELAASAIHRLSQRADGPFIAVNCGALPRDLIQAELFGHEKGAFTGADRAHIGTIESAQNGTLFLDEIGDLPIDLQTNLLRFLQEGSIDRVGGSSHISLNVRTVAATNVDLEKAVAEGRFRKDLYYRLNVLKIYTPPLRDRGEDICNLADSFFRKYSQKINPSLKGFTSQALNALKTHHWPGNIREMTNRIQRAVVMCEGKLITIPDLGLDENIPCGLGSLSQARAAAEKAVIEATLSHLRNNVSQAAKQLDISRVTLYRLMESHGIDWQNNSN